MTSSTRTRDWTIPICGVALFASAAWAVLEHASVRVLPYDDAFITYRYVENLTRGAGLTYNPPVRAWGFTSPLYLLWLTALHLAFSGVDLPTLAVRANAVFVLAAGAGAFLLIERYTANARVACVGACVLMVHPSLLSISAGGMESVLFLALVLFALLAMASGRSSATGTLVGLAFLTRPEAVVLVPVALFAYWRRPRQLIVLLAAAGAIAGAWLVFTALYYDSIVPLSVIAKNRPLYPLPAGHAFRTIAGYMGPTLFGPLAPVSPARTIAAAAVLVSSTAACVCAPRLRARGAWMPGVFAILTIALYAYGNPMFFEWYWPAMLGTSVIAVILGGAGLSLLATPEPGASASRGRRTLRAVAVWSGPVWIATAAFAAYGDNVGGHSKSIRFLEQDGTRLRVLTYQRIGKYLTALTGGRDSVAAPEIGALGYYFSGPVIDACGLVSPEAIRFLPVPPDQRAGPTVGAISVELVQSTNPDWVVSMPIFAQKSLLRSDWFAGRYELALTVPLPKICFDSVNVLVFKRRTEAAVGSPGNE